MGEIRRSTSSDVSSLKVRYSGASTNFPLTLTTRTGHVNWNGAIGLDRNDRRKVHLNDRCDRRRLLMAYETFTDIQRSLGRTEGQPCQDEQ